MNGKFLLYIWCLLSFSVATGIFNPCFSANRYWVGAVAGDWNNTANWSLISGGVPGAAVPVAADIAFFDGGGSAGCTISINAAVTGISISPAYLGTIGFNPGVSAIIGTSGFSQAGGTVTGNNGAITVNGPFSLSGGTFNSTSGVLQLGGGYTFTGGSFNPNNGTVAFSGTQTITGNTALYNLLFAANGGIYTLSAGTTLISTNNVTVSGTSAYTVNTGIIEIRGDLTLLSSGNNSVNGGTATFLFNGTGTQTINSAISSVIVGTNERMCALPNIEINKSSGNLNLNGVVSVNGTSWKTTAGSALVNPGTSTVNILSSVTFSGQNLSLYDIHIWANSQIIVLNPASYVLTSIHNVTVNGGSHYQVSTGTLELLGDLTLITTSVSAANGGTGTFLFDGTGPQSINAVAGSPNNTCALPNVQINKTTGALNLTGTINLNGSSWNTIAGASLINPGTSVVNVSKSTTLSGQSISLYDLTITGDFSFVTINAGTTWTSTHLLTLAGGASWYQINTGTLNAKGDVLVTNTNASNNVGGNAVLLFDGSSNQTLTGSGIAGGGRLPQVQINKTGGTLTLSANSISVDNNWTYVAGTVDAMSNNSTVDFYKTAVIDGQGALATMAFNHVVVSGLLSLGGALDVNGDFTIRSGINNRLDVTATNNYLLTVAGNWTNNNSITPTSFNQQSGKVIFDGGGAQSLTLTSPAHTETFYQLEMNNTGNGLTLLAPLTVSNSLSLITGKIFSTALAPVLVLNGATATGAGNNSFVYGPVSKTGNQAFVFPTGRNGFYAPIAMSAPALSTNQFTAEYFQTDPNVIGNVASKDVTLDGLSRSEYWTLDRTAGTSNVTVSLSWDVHSGGISVISDLRTARWNGSQWNDLGNGGTTGTAVAGTLVSSAAVTAFGSFTLASATAANALPVELISFSANCENRHIVLNWNTASELNNDNFAIRRSTDAKSWTTIATVEGAGNSTNLLKYSYTDFSEPAEASYYCLQQTDQDGKHYYSDVVYVEKCSDPSTAVTIFAYPNPTSGVFTLHYPEHSTAYSTVTVYNITGETVLHADALPMSIDLSDFPDGVYFVKVSGTETAVIRVVKR